MTKKFKTAKIFNCNMNKEVLEMFYDEEQAYDVCKDDPPLSFNLIKKGYFEVVDKLIENNKINPNLLDTV